MLAVTTKTQAYPDTAVSSAAHEDAKRTAVSNSTSNDSATAHDTELKLPSICIETLAAKASSETLIHDDEEDRKTAWTGTPDLSLTPELNEDWAVTPKVLTPTHSPKIQEREIDYMLFGPKGAWYCSWVGGNQAWENLPPELHTKLLNRSLLLPAVACISISGANEWVVVFKDGSIATSGFSLRGKLFKELQDPDTDSPITQFCFAPAGGWILLRDDGSAAWERLPTGLDELLKRRHSLDSKISTVCISGFGGWFIRFSDCECEWEGIPRPMEKVLIQLVRKGDSKIIASLSPADGMQYFLAIGDTASWVCGKNNLENVMNWANGIPVGLSESVAIRNS